jgi:hypothetical protein
MALKIDNVQPLPKVARDRPTASRAREVGEGPTAKVKPARKARAASREDAVSGADPLASPMRMVTSRLQGELWDQLGARAAEIGVPLRLLLTDAIVHALEQPVDDHAAAAKATRRRERLARVDLDA